jgi:arylsulfatase A-like enzyme
MKTSILLIIPFALICGAQAADRKKPNIVVIIADDMGYGDTKSFWPKSKINTPAIERLCSAGIKLTNYHVNPLCTPTRAAFLSGQGSENYGKGGGPEGGVMDEVKLLPQFLKEQGYVTGGFGKWHMGAGQGDHPLDRGFDRWIGYQGGSMPYFKSYVDERNAPLKKPRTYVFNGREPYTKNWNHTTDLWADEAIHFIEENHTKPFYLHLAFNAVHGPLFFKEGSQHSARPDWLKKIADRGVTDAQDQEYIAVVEHMDERIGSVLDCLEKNSLSKDTLVFFFSDNGAITRTYAYSGAAAGDNGPYRAGKATLYEGGVRVPAAMVWPGVIPAGSVTDGFTSQWDFFPTVYQIMGMEVPLNNGPLPLRGKSILEHVKSGGKTDMGERSYSIGIGPNRAVTSGPWKLVNVQKTVGSGEMAEKPTQGPVLFNLSEDPSEKNDVSKQHPEVVQRLKNEIKTNAKDSE